LGVKADCGCGVLVEQKAREMGPRVGAVLLLAAGLVAAGERQGGVFRSRERQGGITLGGQNKPSDPVRELQQTFKALPEDIALTIGLVIPQVSFGAREYTKAVNTVFSTFSKSRGPKLEFLKKFKFDPNQVSQAKMTMTPSPTGLFIPPKAAVLESLLSFSRFNFPFWFRRAFSACLMFYVTLVLTVYTIITC